MTEVNVLDVIGVRKSFYQGATKIEVLRRIDLTLSRGKTVAIIGKSGSGKSTLLSLVGGLDRPDEGQILLKNKDIGHLSEKDLALYRGEHMGIVFQQFHLLPSLTALENVMLPLEILNKSSVRARALNALDQVGLSHRAAHFPHQLSGGEKQRVAIARSIIHSPSVLLADEPSGNLDNDTGESVMQRLFDLAKTSDMSMLLVTHSIEFAKHCDTVLQLDHGELRVFDH